MPYSTILRTLSSSSTSSDAARPLPSRNPAKWGPIAAALAALVLAAVAGCGDDTGGGSPTTSGSSSSSASSSSGAGGEGGMSGAGGAGGEPKQCSPTTNAAPPMDLNVTSVEATIVDVNNQPVANSAIQLCGTNLCLYANTGADGHVLIQGSGKLLSNPAFKYGDAFDTGRFAVPIKAPVTTLGTIVTAAFPPTGEAMVPGKAVISGGVTLTIPADAGVNIDVLAYDTPDKQVFKAAAVPVGAALPSVDPALALTSLYVVAPVDTVFCPAVTVTVDNTANLAPNAAVEFWIHGVGVQQYYVPYGGWTKISDGAVSADGKTISTSPGQGLPILTDFGVRLKP